MIRIICDTLSHPLVNMIVGLVLCVLVGIWIDSHGDAFDSLSASCGAFAVISLDIMFYGINYYLDKWSAKKPPQDLDDEN